MKPRKRRGGPNLDPHPDACSDDLPEEVFDVVSAATLKEEDLLFVPPGDLQLSYEHGYAVVVLDEDLDNEVVAYCRLQFLFAETATEPALLELGAAWVKEGPHRGNGIQAAMYEMLLPYHTDENIIATTTSEKAFQTGKRSKFVLIHRRSLPEKVWLASCSCPLDKTHASTKDNEDCQLAFGEPQQCGAKMCWFRVTPETAVRLKLTPVG